MKRILGATLALALLGSSAAYAHPTYSQPRNNNAAAAFGVGLLAFGLIAALASQNQRRAQPYYGQQPYYGPAYNNPYYHQYYQQQPQRYDPRYDPRNRYYYGY